METDSLLWSIRIRRVLIESELGFGKSGQHSMCNGRSSLEFDWGTYGFLKWSCTTLEASFLHQSELDTMT